jgi:hypothetical protein
VPDVPEQIPLYVNVPIVITTLSTIAQKVILPPPLLNEPDAVPSQRV